MTDLLNPVMDNSPNQPAINNNNQNIPPAVPSWRDSLPADIKDSKSWEKFKSQEDVFKSYLNLEKTLGSKRLAVPTKDSTPEDWDNVYNELGRPKTPNDYTLPKIDNAPDGLFDQSRLNGFRELAHKSGLNSNQFNSLMTAFMDGEINTYNQYQKALEEQKNEGIAKLRAEQGANYDKYMLDFQRVIDTYGSSSPEFIEEAKSSGMINNPSFIKFISGIAQQMTNSSVTNAVGNKPLTTVEATKELQTMMDDRTNPLWDAGHPQHKNAVERMNYLNGIVYSGKV